jgi:hypothetical protein
MVKYALCYVGIVTCLVLCLATMSANAQSANESQSGGGFINLNHSLDEKMLDRGELINESEWNHPLAERSFRTRPQQLTPRNTSNESTFKMENLSASLTIDIQWQKCLGGSDDDVIECVRQTTDGGYIAAGYTRSNNYDVSGNHGGYDAWVVRLDSNGNIVWSKCLGGSGNDQAYDILQTQEGYIMVGDTASNNGDVSGNHGYGDAWVVRLDTSGNIVYQRCVGGYNGWDFAYSIKQTSEGGYIIAGFTTSTDGDCLGNHGYADAWVVKLDHNGNPGWSKCLGGGGQDHAYSVQLTLDGGYIIAGDTYSNNGDVSGNHGGGDAWVVKLDSNGNKQWQKCLGGSGTDVAESIQVESDAIYGDYYKVFGSTNSNNGDVSGNRGDVDAFVATLDSNGNGGLMACRGGSDQDHAYNAQQTIDIQYSNLQFGYIMAGYTASNNGDVSGNHGGGDVWLVKMANNFDVEWQRCLGGSSADSAFSAQKTTDGGYVVAGTTVSNDYDVSGNHGGYADAWVVKVKNKPPDAPSTPSGSISCNPYTSYSYTTSTTDPNLDKVYYQFDWGDGSTSRAPITGFVNSGTSASATHSWSDGTYSVKARAINSFGTISPWSNSLVVTVFSPHWNSLGGYVTSNPSVTRDIWGGTEAWVRGLDNALWVNSDETWYNAGGQLSSDPFGIAGDGGINKIYAVVRGTDMHAWVYSRTLSSVPPVEHWTDLGGYLSEAPTASLVPDPTNPFYSNIIRIAAKGSDNALWIGDLNRDTGAFGGWTGLGGYLTSRPYIFFDAGGREHILVRGAEGALWDSKGVRSGSSFIRTWNSLGGYIPDGAQPVGTSEPGYDNYATAFIKGGDSALWMGDILATASPETCNWYKLGGYLTSGHSAVAYWPDKKIHTFVRGSDNALWENTVTTYPFTPTSSTWNSLGGAMLSYTPAALISGNTKAYCIGTDYALWQNAHANFNSAVGAQESYKLENVTNTLGGSNSSDTAI